MVTNSNFKKDQTCSTNSISLEKNKIQEWQREGKRIKKKPGIRSYDIRSKRLDNERGFSLHERIQPRLLQWV